MHVCITLRFAGTRYHGFQVQKNALSVCEVLQNALESLYGVRPPVKGCSRVLLCLFRRSAGQTSWPWPWSAAAIMAARGAPA